MFLRNKTQLKCKKAKNQVLLRYNLRVATYIANTTITTGIIGMRCNKTPASVASSSSSIFGSLQLRKDRRFYADHLRTQICSHTLAKKQISNSSNWRIHLQQEELLHNNPLSDQMSEIIT